MKHICGNCGGEFTSKAKCWYHMDFECPNTPKPRKAAPDPIARACADPALKATLEDKVRRRLEKP